MAESTANVDIRRVSIPVILAFMVAAACIGATATVIFIRINDLSRMAALEAKVELMERRIVGDRFPAWHRVTMYLWCLQTEKINTGWKCHDPYLLPSGVEDGPVSMLRPPIWNGVVE